MKTRIKKGVILLIITLMLLLVTTSTAFAGSTYDSGTRSTSFLTSDYIIFYPSYDWGYYEGWIYNIYTNKYDISTHTNDGNFNQYTSFSPYFDQYMDNSTAYFNKTGGSYVEAARINYYQWNSQSVILPPGDLYFPGYRNDLTYAINGKIYWFWWWYLDEGWMGATKSVTNSATYLFQ